MKSISRKGARHSSGCLPKLAGAVFVVPSLVVFYFFSVQPLCDWNAAQDWAETPCKVVHSGVEEHPSSDGGPTYSVDIRYEYEVGDNLYTGYRYDFSDGSSSGRSAKQAIADRYPVGSEQVCFVNLGFPDDSVLNREFSWFYMFGFIGLAAASLAVAVIWFTSGRQKSKSLSTRAAMQEVRAPQYKSGETITLKSTGSSLIGFIAVSIIALFWNSIVFAAVYGIATGQGSTVDWLFVLVTIPFLLVGIALIVGAFYFFLALFNPRPELRLSTGYLPLGSSATAQWSFQGNTARIRELKISIVGEEEATYRRGTDTVTDSSTFVKMVLVETTDPGEISSGEVPFTVPEFTAPSFEASNNKIEWHIRVDGDIPKWPDVGESFPVTVAPLTNQDGGTTPRKAEFQEN